MEVTTIPEMLIKFYVYLSEDYLLQESVLDFRKEFGGFNRLYSRWEDEKKEYIDSLFWILLRYYYIASIVESRHYNKTKLRRMGGDYPFQPLSDRGGFISAYVNNIWDKCLLEDVIKLFEVIMWYSSSYGGKLWGGIARHVKKGFEVSTMEEKIAWVDTAFSLQHNTGTALNKTDIMSYILKVVVKFHDKYFGDYPNIYLDMKFSFSPERFISTPIIQSHMTNLQRRIARSLGIDVLGKKIAGNNSVFSQSSQRIKEIPFKCGDNMIKFNGERLGDYSGHPINVPEIQMLYF